MRVDRSRGLAVQRRLVGSEALCSGFWRRTGDMCTTPFLPSAKS